MTQDEHDQKYRNDVWRDKYGPFKTPPPKAHNDDGQILGLLALPLLPVILVVKIGMFFWRIFFRRR
jgi:hypothetical protein